MRDLLKKDISVKAVSILSAILFWLFVINVDNPYNYKSIDVPLRVLNKDTLADKDLYLMNENDIPQTIKINISGRKEILDTTVSSDFVVEIDLAQVNGTEDRWIYISEPTFTKDVKINSYSPRSIELKLENIIGNSFPVTVEQTGTPKQGYRAVRIEYSPDTIPLQHQESIINTVGSIKAVVDLSNADKSFENNVPCKVYSKDGKELTTFRNLSVNVKVTIGKVVPLVLTTRGEPAEGYVETQRTITPQTVTIEGEASVLNSIAELRTEPVEIGGATSSVNANAPIRLPEGVKLVDTPGEATAAITIERLAQKELTLEKDLIEVVPPSDTSLTYELRSDTVTLVLIGRQTDLQAVTIESLKPKLDLSGLGAGTHRLQPEIVLPSQVKLQQAPELEVRISQQAAAN